jgi:hypothetical protein
LTFPDSTTQTTAALADAPSDGSTYGRLNGAWSAVAGGTLAADQLTAGVVAANPTAGPTASGDVLQYNGTDLIWAAGGGGGGPSVSSTVSTAYSSHTLVAGDANNFVHIDQAAYVTVNIPQDSTYSFPIGTIVRIAVENASYLTVSPANYGTGPNVNGANTNQPVFQPSLGSLVINCVKVAADRWVVS